MFIAYQMYRFSYTHSIGLLVLTVFDLFVVWLVWKEYRVVLGLMPRYSSGKTSASGAEATLLSPQRRSRTK